MKIKPEFEFVDIDDEHMAVPVEEESITFKGVVTLSDAAAFLAKNMLDPKTEEELVDLLMQEYDVEPSVAKKDVSAFITSLREIGMLED